MFTECLNIKRVLSRIAYAVLLGYATVFACIAQLSAGWSVQSAEWQSLVKSINYCIEMLVIVLRIIKDD